MVIGLAGSAGAEDVCTDPATCPPPTGAPVSPAPQPTQPTQPLPPTAPAGPTGPPTAAGPGTTPASSANPQDPPPCGNTGQPCEPTDGAQGAPPCGNTGRPCEESQTPNASPVISVRATELIVGQPISVPVVLGGYDPARDSGLDVRVEISVTGGSAQLGTQTGSSIVLDGTLAEVTQQLGALTVTATQSGDVVIKVRAFRIDKPNESISGGATLVAAEPTASPTPTPTQSAVAVVATPSASPQATTAAAPPPTLRSFDPRDNPEFVITSAVTAAAVLGVVGAGALAPTIGGGSQSGGGSGSGTAGSSGVGTSGAGRRPDNADTQSWLADIADTSLTAGASAAGSAVLLGWGDRQQTWRTPLSDRLDQGIARSARRLAQTSPLLLRLIDDGTYLRAMFGSFVGLLPMLGLVLGVLAVANVHGEAITPSLWLVAAVIVIGSLNALAGAAAVLAFAVGLLAMGGLSSVGGVRLLMGLCLIAFGPALVAAGTRPLRRSRDEQHNVWERVTDFVVVPLVAGFLVQGTVRALPGLAGLELPIAADAGLLALIAIAAMLLRMVLEEVAARGYPNRLNEIEFAELPQPVAAQRIAAILLRTLAFAFVSEAFIGAVWQLWVGVALFLLTQVLMLAAPSMPNSSVLFHLVPVGVPRFLLVLLASLGLATLATLLVGEGPDSSQWAFVFLLLPGLVLAGVGMFGREPEPGDTRWYLRPGMRMWYRIGGVVLVAVSVWASQLA